MPQYTKKGMSLVETLVYISILVAVSLLVVNALSSLSSSYRSMRQAEALERTANVALERMVREVRGASSVDTASSLFGSTEGSLVLNTQDESGNPATVRFFLSSGVIRMEENGVDMGPLSPSNVAVEALVFRRVTTPESEAVRIEMTVSPGGAIGSKNFYSTAVLRGSYLP